MGLTRERERERERERMMITNDILYEEKIQECHVPLFLVLLGVLLKFLECFRVILYIHEYPIVK